MIAIISEAERNRRAEIILDSRAALQQGESLEQRTKKREEKSDAWAHWFRRKMDNGCANPVELLPDACARLEQIVDDRVAAAVAELKAALNYRDLRPADPDGLRKWREDAEQRKQEFARERRQSELEQRRAAETGAASECASVRSELQGLRVELTDRRHAELTAIREILAESIDEVVDLVVTLNKRLQTELWNLVKTELGDLRARVDGVLPDTKSALRVASERDDEVSELPNPLPPRRTIN
jgi:hypothetical protein